MDSTTRHATPDAIELAATVLERCDALAAFSEEPDRLTRRFATGALRLAGEAVADWMRAAGMSVRRDAIGNVVGRCEGAREGAPALLLGSHLDTVRDAGRYDGMLGVLVAIACVERLRAAGRTLRFALEVLAFADEEGARYGTAYLGSSVFAGRFDRAVLERRDGDGVAMADALRSFGGDPDALEAAARDPSGLLGYLEVHIEQGPVLEAAGLPVGVVSAIAGQSRAQVVFTGAAGHAGTVPMSGRRDALCAAAEWIVAVEADARDAEGVVATVGELRAEPGASNVIPGRAELSLDVRHADDSVRETAHERLHERAAAIGAARGVEVSWSIVQESPAVACASGLSDLLAEAVAGAGHAVRHLPSGAGHDAAVIAAIAPVAMLFVRCAGGISHNPAEAVTRDDVAVAIEVTSRFLELLDPQED
ncbi:MAG TPA: allantoate amidohydrolase [Solirubrobacteraceae bacterium]|nr:allantoate amidohydrolase [Solirubrobacteraceae bacterium]